MIKKLIKNFSIITAPIFILVLIGVYNNNSKDDKLYTQNQMQDTTSYVMMIYKTLTLLIVILA